MFIYIAPIQRLIKGLYNMHIIIENYSIDRLDIIHILIIKTDNY